MNILDMHFADERQDARRVRIRDVDAQVGADDDAQKACASAESVAGRSAQSSDTNAADDGDGGPRRSSQSRIDAVQAETKPLFDGHYGLSLKLPSAASGMRRTTTARSLVRPPIARSHALSSGIKNGRAPLAAARSIGADIAITVASIRYEPLYHSCSLHFTAFLPWQPLSCSVRLTSYRSLAFHAIS